MAINRSAEARTCDLRDVRPLQLGARQRPHTDGYVAMFTEDAIATEGHRTAGSEERKGRDGESASKS